MFGAPLIAKEQAVAHRDQARIEEQDPNNKGYQTPWIQTRCLRTMLGMSTRGKRPPETLSLRQVFARNIRLVRIHAEMSQERMAAEAGLDRAFVGTLERGQRNISIDNVELLAMAVGVPAYELMNPDLPTMRGLDVTLTRAPRTARVYPVSRRTKKT